MVKRLLLCLFVTLFCFSLVQANPYSFNLYDSPVTIDLNLSNLNMTLDANFSNFSEVWITDIGYADTINISQFIVSLEILSINTSWTNTLYCELVGCTMTGDIDMGLNDIINVDDLEVTNITLFGVIKDPIDSIRTYFEGGAFVVEG